VKRSRIKATRADTGHPLTDLRVDGGMTGNRLLLRLIADATGATVRPAALADTTAFGAARAMWKRSSRPGPAPAVFTETAQRLERLEASVDAIAIEIERISEGQRFVTKLLSEGQPAPMLSAGQRTAETIRGS